MKEERPKSTDLRKLGPVNFQNISPKFRRSEVYNVRKDILNVRTRRVLTLRISNFFIITGWILNRFQNLGSPEFRGSERLLGGVDVRKVLGYDN